ncbi:hypothetical protein [Iningainema tapete]|uniref:Uncharacterized protein n=1 Tax=Iningainema tapete BLCC-T55 TaxID=2748662 RepID=A0A8J6XV09_9CYAN|nr:hypothetical protein [Iningainema tapete]MBD2778251.1 hypothetical protein [Iningainema tapete BLCC-T55]
MSLTSEINNKNSAIRKWFESKFNSTIAKLLANHNQIMAQQPRILPSLKEVDFALCGHAVSYFLKKYLSLKTKDENWIYNTLAYAGAKMLNVEHIIEYCATGDNALDSEALKCILLGSLERYKRSGIKHEILQPFLQGQNQLNLETKYFKKWLPTIRDVSAIIESVPHSWHVVDDKVQGKIIPHATFTLSNYIGGADCLVCGDALIDIRTTVKRCPFTLENFYQQISYVLLDYDDQYGIQQLIWFYSRQDKCILLPHKQTLPRFAITKKRIQNHDFRKLQLRT